MPYLAKLSYTHLCIIEGLHGLNEIQIAIALHVVDAEGQPNSDWGQLRGQWRDYDMDTDTSGGNKCFTLNTELQAAYQPATDTKECSRRGMMSARAGQMVQQHKRLWIQGGMTDQMYLSITQQ